MPSSPGRRVAPIKPLIWVISFLPYLQRFGNAHHPLTAESCSLTTGFRSIPIRSIPTSQRSPAFIHSGGFRERPTPAGVPVTNTSPGTERDPLANERDLRGNIEDH